MGVMIVGGILFGTVLGRFFKVYILVPASALAVVLVLASPAPPEGGLWSSMLEIGVLVTSLQVGYLVGLVAGFVLLQEGSSRAWGQRATSSVSRSYRIR